MSASRAPLRSEQRADERPLDERTADILAHIQSGDEDEDRFAIPPDAIPEGTSYEWKRFSTFGKEDPHYQANLARMGWTPVPADRHPAMLAPGSTQKTVEQDGMVLMERPAVLTKAVQDKEYRKAVGRVRDNEIQLGQAPANTAPRAKSSGDSLVKVRTSYEAPIAIPE